VFIHDLWFETFAKRPLLPPAIGGMSGSNFNPQNTQCIPVVNPAIAGSPFLNLNPALREAFFKNLGLFFMGSSLFDFLAY
jgi:hypothetical protein